MGWKLRILENMAQIGLLAYFDLLVYIYFKIYQCLNSVADMKMPFKFLGPETGP